MSAYLKTFDEIPIYSDPGSQNQTCRDIMPRGIVPGMLVGYNILEGPGCTGLGNHTEWHQVFVVVQGSATLLRGAERIPVAAPCIIHIPPHTDHDMLVAPGQRVEYVYINKYLSTED
ncbi:MAG: hypothetical protein U0401_02120 [Anaerolineae bacterium]